MAQCDFSNISRTATQSDLSSGAQSWLPYPFVMMGRMSLSISCSDCTMHSTPACDDCVVTFVLGADTERANSGGVELDLDVDQERVVQLFSRAGMVPLLKFHVAS